MGLDKRPLQVMHKLDGAWRWEDYLSEMPGNVPHAEANALVEPSLPCVTPDVAPLVEPVGIKLRAAQAAFMFLCQDVKVLVYLSILLFLPSRLILVVGSCYRVDEGMYRLVGGHVSQIATKEGELTIIRLVPVLLRRIAGPARHLD